MCQLWIGGRKNEILRLIIYKLRELLENQTNELKKKKKKSNQSNRP